MDFNSYYMNQASGNDNVFRGSAFQRGYGLGGAFRRFFSWVMPILKQNLQPHIGNIGKEIVNGVSNFTTDAIKGKDLEESAKQHFQQAVKNLGGHVGHGYKRKRKNKKNISKKKLRIKDIFD
jgi:hypothetical protein